MSRSNIDKTLGCVNSSKETQDKEQSDSEEAENEVEASTERIEPDSTEFRSTNSNLWLPEGRAALTSSNTRNGVDASQIEGEASEPEMTWEEVEEEWFEFGSDFMIF